jgi:hypothetical protein
MMNTLPCPYCGAYLDVPDELIGRLVECEGCHRAFQPSAQDVLPKRPVRVEPTPKSKFEESRAKYNRNDDTLDEFDRAPAAPSDLKPGQGFAITSLVLGICSVIFGVALWFVCCPFVQTLPGVLSIFFGYMGLKTEGRGMAIAGMICGTLAVVLSFVPIMLFGAFLSSVNAAKPAVPPPAPAMMAPVTATPWTPATKPTAWSPVPTTPATKFKK